MIKYNDYTMLFDESICVECEACTVTCKQIYEPAHGVYRTKMQQFDTGEYPNSISVFNKHACYHCHEAACLMACPTGAIHKSEEGLTVINDDICINCNWCASNCPFGYIAPDRDNGVMEKCSLCEERLRAGKETLCLESCTTRAIKTGSRDEMLAYAKNRVNQLKEQGYDEANVYGNDQLGGLRLFQYSSTLRKSTICLQICRSADPTVP